MVADDFIELVMHFLLFLGAQRNSMYFVI